VTSKPKNMVAEIDVRTESIKSELTRIAAHYNGVLNPRQVVEAARDESHALHGEFCWDDSEAADRYRIAQAGALIRRVSYTITRQDPKTKEIRLTTTRAYQSRPSMRSADGGYEDVNAIVSDEEKRQEMLRQVMSELAAYRRRYDALVELRSVWAAIDEAALTAKELKAPRKHVAKNVPVVRRGKASMAR